MHSLCFFLFIGLLQLLPNMSSVGSAQDAPFSEGSVFLPKGRPFLPLATDPRDLKTGFRKTSQNKMEGDLGAYRSLYGWAGQIRKLPTVFHAGIEGNAYFTMRKQGSRFPLESSDGLFGLYAEASRNFFLYQIRFTHISAHLSDGAENVLANIRYSREFLVARVAYTFHGIQPYAGISYLVHTIPKSLSKTGLQIGFYSTPFPHWKRISPYFGADWRMHQGAEGKTLNASFGLLFHSLRGAPPIRITGNYLTGNDLRGQFYDQKIKKFSIGFDLDIQKNH